MRKLFSYMCQDAALKPATCSRRQVLFIPARCHAHLSALPRQLFKPLCKSGQLHYKTKEKKKIQNYCFKEIKDYTLVCGGSSRHWPCLDRSLGVHGSKVTLTVLQRDPAFQEIRTMVREVEQTAREIQTIMQAIHQAAATHHVLSVCEKSEPQFAKAKEQFSELAKKIPDNQYYRFNDMWRFVIQRMTYLAALKVYLREDRLISQQETADMLGVKAKREDDFLMGLLTMASELSRFAVNAVVSGDPGRPVRVSKFLSELDSGFRLLNLKNDMLRKRFD